MAATWFVFSFCGSVGVSGYAAMGQGFPPELQGRVATAINFAMLVLVYYLGAELFLIDPTVMELSVWQAVAISVASLAFGWVAYNTLCKVFVNADQNVLMVTLFVLLVAMSWFYTQVFSGRAAMLHLGAFTASIMTGNVFFVIMPGLIGSLRCPLLR